MSKSDLNRPNIVVRNPEPGETLKPFEDGMTLAPGEGTTVKLAFSEDQILEMLYRISQGEKPELGFTYEDEQGNKYETRLPIERERLEAMRDNVRRK